MELYKYIAEMGKLENGKSDNYDIVVQYNGWMNGLIAKVNDIKIEAVMKMDLEDKKIKEEEITNLLKTGKKNLNPSPEQTKSI